MKNDISNLENIYLNLSLQPNCEIRSFKQSEVWNNVKCECTVWTESESFGSQHSH